MASCYGLPEPYRTHCFSKGSASSGEAWEDLLWIVPVGGAGAKAAKPVGKAVVKVVCFIFCKKAAKAGDDVAFHYTRSEVVGLIKKNGLPPGSYLTKSGNLRPLQAQIDLALPPNRGLPGAVIRVDLAGLRKAGYDIGQFTRVGRGYGMPGGGTELRFEKAIPAQFVKVVRR